MAAYTKLRMTNNRTKMIRPIHAKIGLTVIAFLALALGARPARVFAQAASNSGSPAAARAHATGLHDLELQHRSLAYAHQADP